MPAPITEDTTAATSWSDVVAPVGTSLLVIIILAVDELNPVKVFCSYAAYFEPLTLTSITEGRIALVAAALLFALVVNQRQLLLYYAARIFFRCTFNNMFFSSIEIVGMENLPQKGPLILTGNHNNQFVDGMILLTNCSRQISFMIAQKSWERPLVGFLARAFHCIPVARPQDMAFKGTGTVFADGSHRLRGEATCFLKQVEVGAQLEIVGSENVVKVKQVISDTEVEVDSPLGTSTASGHTFKIHPKVNQAGMYEEVYGGLRQGKCLGIFPEGGSHDRTDLLPLKAGVALIALDAFAKHHMTVPIVPVGLNYFQGHRFGGRVVVEFGPPIVVPEQIYVQHETDRRGSVEALLQLIATGMRSVIIPTRDYHTLQQIYMARRLYVPDGLKLSAEQTMDLNRRFAVGIQRLLNLQASGGGMSEATPASARQCSRGESGMSLGGYEDIELSQEDFQAMNEFKADVASYMTTLKRLGLRDHQVRQIGWWGVPDLAARLMYLLVTMCLGAIPNLLFNLPVMFIASKLAATEQQKSLKASKVKLAARDVVMSYKIIYVLVLVPCLYVFYGTLILTFFNWCTTTVILVLVACPAFAFLGMKASEQGVRAYADIVPLFMRLLPGPRAEQDALPAQRAALQKKLNQAVKRFGPRFGDLYQRKQVDWAKEMGWFTYAAANNPSTEADPSAAPADAAVKADAKAASIAVAGDGGDKLGPSDAEGLAKRNASAPAQRKD